MIEERLYTIGLIIILIMEILLSLPLMIDSIISSSDIQIIYILVTTHIFMLIYGNVWRLKRRRPKIHYIGCLAFIVSFIPFIGFILHVVVTYMIIKELITTYKKERNFRKSIGS